MMRSLLAVALVLAFAACLPEPKTGCHTTDDCISGRVCVAGTCQSASRDTGLDASPDGQSLRDGTGELPEASRPDVVGDFQVPSDAASLPIDLGLESRVVGDKPDRVSGMDVIGADNPEDAAADLPDYLPDLATAAIDVVPDAPLLAIIDAQSSFSETSNPDLPADLVPFPIDAALDASNAATIDAAPNAASDLAPGAVSWEDFRARCPREPWVGGRYIVDGDLAFDEAGLQSYYNAWFAAEGVLLDNLAPMGATTRWPFPDSMSLSYCISTDFGDNLAAVEAAMQVATTSWSAQVGAQYAYLSGENASCDANDTNVTFDVRPVSGAGYSAVSFFPNSPRSARSLLIDVSAFAIGTGGVDLEGTLRHQVGHTLGFQHEDLWLDPACTSEDTRLAVPIANYDVDSVMHLPSCRPSESGGIIQTEDDLVGAITIYGLSPALTVMIGM